MRAWSSKILIASIVLSFNLLGLTFSEAETNIAETEAGSVALTEAEKAWLKEHKTLRLGVDPAWPPFEFIDSAKFYSGIASDYVRHLDEQLNIQMAPVPDLSWPDVMDRARKGGIDVLPCVVKTSERSRFLLFTKPYLSFPMVILTRQDAPFINDVKDFENDRVAVVKGYVSQELLERDYPDRDFYLANDIDEALKAVSREKVDAFVGNLASITYAAQRLGLTNLKISTSTPYKYELAFAVRKDWPLLVSILEKGLASMPDPEKMKIQNRWINVRFERGIDWSLVLKLIGAIVFVSGLILIVILRWNRRLAREVAERKQTETALLESRATARGLLDATQESLLLLNGEGTILSVNRTAANRLQKKPEELVGVKYFSLLSPDIREYGKAKFDQVMRTSSPETFEDTRDGIIFHSSFFPVQTKTGTPMGVAIFAQDVTDRKRAEEALRESEISLRTIFQNSPMGITRFSKDGTILDCNDLSVEQMGSSREKLIGFNAPKETKNEKLRAAILKALSGETAEFEGDYKSVTGNKTAAMRIIFNPTNPGQTPTEVIGTSEDITERKRAEEELRRNMEDLERFSKLAFGREERMIELKKEINEMLRSSGRPDKYKIVA